MTWGTPEQKERYLTPILTAEEVWCQGFSEPDAGSDLASLKTRAVKEDGGWRVSGQKVWTSAAQYSQWCMLVARTDPEVPKHKGLTYFLMDMAQDAIQVRPLRQITGEQEFNELFIDGAWIPDENVLGGEGNGWKVALTTLMNERAGLAFFLQIRLRQLLDQLIDEAAQRGLLDHRLLHLRRQHLGHLGVDQARGEAIDADVVRRERLGAAAGEGDHPRLGRGVMDLHLPRPQRRHRRQRHDAAEAALDHLVLDREHHQQQQVDRQADVVRQQAQPRGQLRQVQRPGRRVRHRDRGGSFPRRVPHRTRPESFRVDLRSRLRRAV